MRLLNLERVPTKTGAEWAVPLIGKLLKSPIVIGKVRFDGEVYDGVHEPIVDEETFHAAQERLSMHRKIHLYGVGEELLRRPLSLLN